jgi:hypothetical protein
MATLVLPLTWLRSCCTPAMTAARESCCTQPSLCVVAGGVVGLVAALTLPASTRRLETGAGISLGMAAIAILRCTALLVGEMTGLILGVALGVAAATLARDQIARRRAHG